jgi:hypothetical protein
MTRDEFLTKLRENNIDSRFVSFDDNIKDGYCLRKNYYRWETFVRERGKEYDVVGFPCESNALESLLKEILSIYGK